MLPFKIHINPEINQENLNIVEDYWHIRDNKFVTNIAQLIEEYSLDRNKITQIIKDNSHLLFQLKCYDCKIDFEKRVETRRYVIRKNYFERCERCAKIVEEYYSNSEQRRIENEKLHKERLEEAKNQKMKEAIETQKWLELNDYEFDILKKIISDSSLKGIRKNVFKGSFKHSDIWKIVYRLGRLGLIHIVRNGNDYVDHIEFDPQMAACIQNFILPNKSIKPFSFSIVKNSNRKENDAPDYCGILTFSEDVTLRAGVGYEYEGISLNDGSIVLNLKIREVN